MMSQPGVIRAGTGGGDAMKIAAALLSLFVLPFAEASETAPPVLATAVQQLRQAAGSWNVTTHALCRERRGRGGWQPAP
jgi:hypothetical protein